uniref:Prenylcysteine oxidase 1 n=1 Tax=Cyprinus carpio carpio TaxID=630221 RepID=A0A8C0YV44_CYPCA
MALRHLSVKTLFFLGLCQVGRRGFASSPEVREAPKKIAIIGGGIGGTAAGFFLRQEFGPAVKIDVFEAGTVGGRLATENIGGHEYETGGSVIHPLNLHMKHFLDKLSLSPRADVSSKVAIFDGKELTFEESDWFIVNFIRMLWRYGFNSIRMHMWVEGILDKFMRIYQYQQYGYSFSSVEKLLHAMGGDGFLTLFNQTLEEAMLAEGFSQVFLNDVVTPVTRVNYGQSVQISAFAGAVALAGADSGLWAVDGGNKMVCSGLLYHSKAELVPARATTISMKMRPSKTDSASNFYEVNYVVATLVHGLLNVSYLGTTEKPEDFYVSEVLTLENKASEINSLSSLNPVKIPKGYSPSPASQRKVWKIFSSQPLSQQHLQQIFLSWDSVFEKRWLAYPSYSPPNRRTPPFILHDRLYYLNAVEWAASAMEMSAISARNLALLAHHRWYEQTDKINQEDLDTRLRGEL